MASQKKSGGLNTDRLKLELRRAAIPFLMLVVLFVVGFANASNIIRNLSGAKFWKDYTEYRVAFENPEGVIPSRHELRIAGVKSGYIKDAQLEDGVGVLTLAVDKEDAPLYKNAHVQIRPVTPLEDMYVDITSRGTEDAGELENGENGDILPMRNTESMVEVGKVLNVLDDTTRPRMATLINQLSVGMRDNGESLKRAFVAIGPFLKNAERMSKVLAERRETVKSLVGNLAETTEVLGDRDRELTSFIRSGRNTVTELAKNDAPLAATLRNLPGTVNSLRSAFASLEATEDRLDGAFRALRPAATSLPTGFASLREFNKDAEPALTALRPAVRAIRPLARQLRPTADTLAQTFPEFRDRSPAIAGAVDKLAQPRCQDYVGDLLSHVSSMTKFGVGGMKGQTHARAEAQFNFASVGRVLKDPNWIIEPPCYTNDTKPIKGGDLAPLNGPNRETP